MPKKRKGTQKPRGFHFKKSKKRKQEANKTDKSEKKEESSDGDSDSITQECDPLAVELNCISAPEGEVVIQQDLESMGECLKEHSAAVTSSNEYLVKEECSGLINVTESQLVEPYSAQPGISIPTAEIPLSESGVAVPEVPESLAEMELRKQVECSSLISVKSSEYGEECDPVAVEMDCDSASEGGEVVIKEIPLQQALDIKANIEMVSDIVVIENIKEKSNVEKPWFSLKDPFFKEAVDPFSPTTVLVIPGPLQSSELEGPSPLQDENRSEQTFRESPVQSSESYERRSDSSVPETAHPVRDPTTPRGNGGDPATETQLFLEVRDCLLLLLPNRWTPFVIRDGIHVGFMADRKPTLTQRSLHFSSDGTVLAEVNGKDVPGDHPFWQFVGKQQLNAGTVKEFSEFILKTVNSFRSYEICKGVEQFEEVWKTAKNVEVDYNRFHESRFKKTCRSSQCYMLVPSLKVHRCVKCQPLWKILSMRSASRRAAENTPDKKKPYMFLSTPQKKKRYDEKNKEIKRLKAANARYREKINEMIDKEGVSVDEDTAADFVQILSDETNVSKLTEFQRLFIEQQLKASSVAGASGMRWHPAIIRLALSLSMTSPTAYEDLSAFIKLPSRRQLFDYSHAMESKGDLNLNNSIDSLNRGSQSLASTSGFHEDNSVY